MEHFKTTIWQPTNPITTGQNSMRVLYLPTASVAATYSRSPRPAADRRRAPHPARTPRMRWAPSAGGGARKRLATAGWKYDSAWQASDLVTLSLSLSYLNRATAFKAEQTAGPENRSPISTPRGELLP